MIANIITVSRILFSLLLLVFPHESYFFAALYILCGVSDALDGFVARILHTESKNGAILDSVADLLFVIIYAVRILPFLSLPIWIWVWTLIIAVTKVTGIIIASKKVHGLSIEHSLENKLTGLLLYLLPLSAYIWDVKYGATLVCVVATVTVVIEIKK